MCITLNEISKLFSQKRLPQFQTVHGMQKFHLNVRRRGIIFRCIILPHSDLSSAGLVISEFEVKF